MKIIRRPKFLNSFGFGVKKESVFETASFWDYVVAVLISLLLSPSHNTNMQDFSAEKDDKKSRLLKKNSKNDFK